MPLGEWLATRGPWAKPALGAELQEVLPFPFPLCKLRLLATIPVESLAKHHEVLGCIWLLGIPFVCEFVGNPITPLESWGTGIEFGTHIQNLTVFQVETSIWPQHLFSKERRAYSMDVVMYCNVCCKRLDRGSSLEMETWVVKVACWAHSGHHSMFHVQNPTFNCFQRLNQIWIDVQNFNCAFSPCYWFSTFLVTDAIGFRLEALKGGAGKLSNVWVGQR